MSKGKQRNIINILAAWDLSPSAISQPGWAQLSIPITIPIWVETGDTTFAHSILRDDRWDFFIRWKCCRRFPAVCLARTFQGEIPGEWLGVVQDSHHVSLFIWVCLPLMSKWSNVKAEKWHVKISLSSPSACLSVLSFCDIKLVGTTESEGKKRDWGYMQLLLLELP